MFPHLLNEMLLIPWRTLPSWDLLKIFSVFLKGVGTIPIAASRIWDRLSRAWILYGREKAALRGRANCFPEIRPKKAESGF
jgi:hypothetical protein